MFITDMPTTKAELRTKCQPFESSTVQIKIAPHPFARGGVRAAYRALVLHEGVWKEYILKMFLAPKNRTSEQYLIQLESNNVAKCLANIFMTKTSEGKRAAKIGQRISFLESRAVRVTKQDGQIVWYNMEKVIDGTFDKWTDNNGYCNPRPENRTLLEFAKWTYEWTALPRHDCRYSSGRRSFCAFSDGVVLAEVVMWALKLQNQFATARSIARAWHVHLLAYISISI